VVAVRLLVMSAQATLILVALVAFATLTSPALAVIIGAIAAAVLLEIWST